MSKRFVIVEPIKSDILMNKTKFVFLVIDPAGMSIQSFNSPESAWGYIDALENQETFEEDDSPKPG